MGGGKALTANEISRGFKRRRGRDRGETGESPRREDGGSGDLVDSRESLPCCGSRKYTPKDVVRSLEGRRYSSTRS